jgi:hypothetical protein
MMNDEQVGSSTPDPGSGTSQPSPSAGDQPVEIDLNPWVGQEGGVDSARNMMPNPEVETTVLAALEEHRAE